MDSVRLIREPPKIEDLRFTLSGLTSRQLSLMYWALRDSGKIVPKLDNNLMQALWGGAENE